MMWALELISALCNGGYALGLAFRKRWAWPLGFLGTVAAVLVMFRAKLYAESVLNLGYAVLALYGWLAWSSPKPPQKISRARSSLLGVLLGLGAAAVMTRYTDNPRPVVDAMLFAGGIVGTLWQAQKDRLNWILWMLLNAASLWLYLDRGLLVYAAYAAVMVGFSVWGWRRWGVNP